ncbi:MAG: hypothetical protein H0V82_05455 [Candidatus Protochlamydia sp.]|nr:hypothetical protein [Candidatus Protochlamydia sp.]
MQKFAKIILFALTILIQSCGTISEFSDTLASNIPIVNYFAGCNYCTVKIKSSKRTNQGAPFYMVVKPTDFSTFLSEDYPKIAKLLESPPEENPGFETLCIVPGKDQMFTIERPPGFTSLGFYFLFTNPGNIWKQIVEIVDGAPVIRIVLDGNEVASIG